MLKDNEGRTTRFDDKKKSVDLRLRILRTPHLVTYQEIIDSGLSDVNVYMEMFAARLEHSMKQARELVKTSAAFVPASFTEARMKGDSFDYMQAEIWSKVISEGIKARRAGKTFDPVVKAQELIAEFIKGDEGARIKAAANAVEFLKTLNIRNEAGVEIYINKNMSLGRLSNQQISKIRNMGRLAFPGTPK
jgi:hypothetical protein